MDGTILSQGVFGVPAVIVPVNIPVPSGVDWVSVLNVTQAGTAGQAPYPIFGVSYFWQIGMPVGSAVVTYNSNAGSIVNRDYIASGGIYLYDPSGNNPYSLPLVGNAVATTATTNQTRPVVSTGNTAGLAVGSIVRISNTLQSDVNGVDFVVGAVNPGVSFTLLTATNPLANVPGGVGGAGFYRIENYSPLFYPRRLYVVNITQAALPVVSTSVPHGLTPGQQVRFTIPAVASMIQLDQQQATIVTVLDDYNFQINFNTTFATAFTWPTLLQTPCSYPIVVPFGENTSVALASVANQVPSIGGNRIYGTQSGILADATVNTGFLGMTLGTGAPTGSINAGIYTGPAGSAQNDLVVWRVGKSSYGGQ